LSALAGKLCGWPICSNDRLQPSNQHAAPHTQLDAVENLAVINEIAEAKSCDTTVFFEARKKRDLYMWLSATPAGPSVKFHVVNAHTMDELRLTGNALRGSRPILSFDRAFDDEEAAPQLRVIRELLSRTFAPPRLHPKVQPFHDRVINFGYADGKVWFRHYQIVDKAADVKAAAKMLAAGEQPTVLVEIGPRFVLDPVRVFSGSFGGATLWQNPDYMSPNAVRRDLALAKAGKYTSRILAETERKEREKTLVLPADPVADIFKTGGSLGEAVAGAGSSAAGRAAAGAGGSDEDDEEGLELDDDGEEDGEGDEVEEEEEEEEEAPPPPKPAAKGKGKGKAVAAAAPAAVAAAPATGKKPASKPAAPPAAVAPAAAPAKAKKAGKPAAASAEAVAPPAPAAKGPAAKRSRN
jgi:ribosome biogenesis protein BRX1